MTQKTVKQLPMSEISPLIVGLINDGVDVTILVTGNSMRPMLKHLRDTVVLTKCDSSSLKKGDIPLYKRENGQYVLHRILKVHSDYYDISGDNQWELEKAVKYSQVLCKVKGFTRNGKYHSVNELPYRIYECLWRKLFFLRKYIKKIYIGIRHLFKRTDT